MTTYFGFALASSMFSGGCMIEREVITEITPEFVAECDLAINCCNASHAATVQAAYEKFGLSLQIPEKPPTVELEEGDTLIVMGVKGLPRLTDRHHYTAEEIASAKFEFVKYIVHA